MRFNLSMLMDLMRIEGVELIREHDGALTLTHAVMISENAQPATDAAIIVPMEKSSLLERLGETARHAIILISGAQAEPPMPEAWDIMRIPSGNTLEAYDAVMKAIFELNTWHEALSDAILRQLPLQETLDIAARPLKNPVALFDMSITLLAWAGNMPEHFTDPVWENVLKQGYNTLETFPEEVRRQMADSIGKGEVVIVPPLSRKNVNHNMMTTLWHNGVPFACMAMNELCADFDNAEYGYLCAIKELLEQSPELLRNVVLAKDRGSRIFSRLISGAEVDDAQLSIFMRENAWKPDDSYRLFLFRFSESEKLNEHSYRAYADLIRNADGSLVLFYVSNAILGVARVPAVQEKREDCAIHRDRLNPVWQQTGIYVGASMDFSDYRNLQYAYQQAQAAWRYASDRAWLITYEAIFGKYLLDTLKENHNLTHYCHSALLRFDRAREWDRELLRTLRQYLLNGRRVSKTANELHIHRNTMINRINIINGVLGTDIDTMDEEAVVHYLISLLIQDSDVIPK